MAVKIDSNAATWSVVEVVEDPAPNALDMMRCGTFERHAAAVGEDGHHHAPVESRTPGGPPHRTSRGRRVGG